MVRDDTGTSDIDKPVMIVLVIISVIFLSKIVFWLSWCTLIFGVIFYLKTKGTSHAKLALLIIGVSFALLPITYVIGYRIENVPMFNAAFDFLANASSHLI